MVSLSSLPKLISVFAHHPFGLRTRCVVIYRKPEGLQGLESAFWLKSCLDGGKRQTAATGKNLQAERKEDLHGRIRV